MAKNAKVSPEMLKKESKKRRIIGIGLSIGIFKVPWQVLVLVLVLLIHLHNSWYWYWYC